MAFVIKKHTDKYVTTEYILYLVVFIVYIYTVSFTLIHNLKSDGYVLGDWLINYQDGGFKRRGLSGSLFFLLQDITGIKLNILVYTFQFIIITFFFATFAKIIRNKKISLLYLSLILSSIGFIGILNNVNYVGKKEFIVFAIYAYFIYLIDRGKLTKFKEWGICFLLFISVLFHEVGAFYVPYFVIALYVKDKKIDFWRFSKYFLAVFIPVITLFVFGKQINEGNSLEILKERGVVITGGILFWKVDERLYFLEHYKEYVLYIISLAISILHVIFYIKEEVPQEKKSLNLLLIGAFVFSLPLFYLALDWGRWMYIHMIFIILLMTLYLPKKLLTTDKLLKNRKFYITLFIIIFSLIYRVEMSGWGFTFQGLFYRVFIAPLELLNKMI